MQPNVEIKNRYSGSVLWSGEVEEPTDTSANKLLGLAVIEAIKNGAYLVGADLGGADLVGADLGGADLGGADLRGAYLRGAYLGGLKLIARASRANYEFILWSSVLGGHIIRAGCRTMTIPEYRAHVAAEYPGSDKAEETLAILDYLEGRLNKFLED